MTNDDAGKTDGPEVAWLPAERPMTGTLAGDPAGSAVPSLSLWSPRDIGIAAFLLGFPAGLGTASRNWYRMGQRGKAYAHMAAGVVGLLVLVLLPNLPTGAGIGISVAIGVYLYQQTRRDQDQLRAQGRAIQKAGGASGLATALAAWLVIGAPSVVALNVLGADDVVPGTVAFGTGGTNCEISGTATTFDGDRPIHYVAHLSRTARPGEVIHEVLRVSGQFDSAADFPVAQDANCLWGDFPVDALDDGQYSLELTIGSERVASGELRIAP